MASLKLIHLVYAVVAMVVVIVAAFLATAYLFNAPVTSAIGNGWKQVAGVSAYTVGGRLYVSFIGIEGCQFCAAERYALFAALSNFGNWTYYGSAVTLSALPTGNLTTNPEPYSLFYKASEGDWTLNFLSPHLSYTSNYIDFVSTETLDNNGNPLQNPTAIQNGYLSKYDSGGSVPFTVVGGNFYEIGAGESLVPNGIPVLFNPNGVGYMPSYIISNFNTSGSQMNSSITTESNYISAIICFDISNAAPACSTSAIKLISSKL
ncbi:MAG: DUF929 domain-containing protein [Candidatus Parvarchaeota archaeon]|jgi:hypothetical protein|nr:DUF929 domain-containing protein [Candidatus Parvarchaeota archaeon]